MNNMTKTSFLEIKTLQAGMPLESKAPRPAFTILWVLGGRVKCQVDCQQFEVGENQLVCIRPGRCSRLQYSGYAEGYLLSFTDAYLGLEGQEFDINYQRGLFRIFSQSAKIGVQEEVQDEMRGIMEMMQKESGNSFRYKDQILRRYLKIFLIYVSRHSQETHEDLGSSRGSEIVQEFMGLLEKNFKEMRSVAEYAQSLSVTPNHLNVVVKKNTGQTAGYHIKQRLTLEAKRLIVYSHLCMKEIANELGFSDTAHFSKFFKNCSGSNYSDFKRQHLSPMAMA
jgi:AraC-like DNA-binding protein